MSGRGGVDAVRTHTYSSRRTHTAVFFFYLREREGGRGAVDEVFEALTCLKRLENVGHDYWQERVEAVVERLGDI